MHCGIMANHIKEASPTRLLRQLSAVPLEASNICEKSYSTQGCVGCIQSCIQMNVLLNTRMLIHCVKWEGHILELNLELNDCLCYLHSALISLSIFFCCYFRLSQCSCNWPTCLPACLSAALVYLPVCRRGDHEGPPAPPASLPPPLPGKRSTA